jgi:hypothetical protein
VGGNARWPVLSFEVAFWCFHASQSWQGQVTNLVFSTSLVSCWPIKARWKALSNGEAFLFTLHHNEGITFQRNGCMRRIEKVQPRASPSDNRIWDRREKHEECPLRKLIETNGRSFKLRFGIGATRGTGQSPPMAQSHGHAMGQHLNQR